MTKPDAKGWLNLGYLTDKVLVLRVLTFKSFLESRAGTEISLASTIRRLIKSGLQTEEGKINGTR